MGLYDKVVSDRKNNGAKFDKDYIDDKENHMTSGKKRERSAISAFSLLKRSVVPDDMSSSGSENEDEERNRGRNRGPKCSRHNERDESDDGEETES